MVHMHKLYISLIIEIGHFVKLGCLCRWEGNAFLYLFFFLQGDWTDLEFEIRIYVLQENIWQNFAIWTKYLFIKKWQEDNTNT